MDIQARAKRRHAALARARRDPRYKRVLGRYVAAGLLTTTEDVELHRDPLRIDDVLRAGRTEPRFLELLPALVVKRPAFFERVAELPADLAEAVQALRRNEEPPDFRGISGATLRRWVPSIGHRGKVPSRLRSFRLQASDLRLLQALSSKLGVTQTEVLRRGIRRLAASELLAGEGGAEGVGARELPAR